MENVEKSCKSRPKIREKSEKYVIAPPFYGDYYKIAGAWLSICLSICPSFRQFFIFLRNGSLVCSGLRHNGR